MLLRIRASWPRTTIFGDAGFEVPEDNLHEWETRGTLRCLRRLMYSPRGGRRLGRIVKTDLARAQSRSLHAKAGQRQADALIGGPRLLVSKENSDRR